MESLVRLEAFVRTAELGSFSAAGRKLEVTPAAVSRNVGVLESALGVRLFQRSTRSLALTEAGEKLLYSVSGSLAALEQALLDASAERTEPSGTLRVSMSPTFGITHILPLLPDLLSRYPGLRAEWHFENRQVDLIGEGYDAAIGAGIELSDALVARPLAPAHIVPVASPALLAARDKPITAQTLGDIDGIVMRSQRTGRTMHWTLRDASGNTSTAQLKETVVVNDPAALRKAAELGLGVAMLSIADMADALEAGTLVRLLPGWFVDAGSISIYYASRTLLPSKVRVFVDHVVAGFGAKDLARRFSAA